VGRKKLGFIYLLTGFPPKLIRQLKRIRKNSGISGAEVIRQGTQAKADEIEKKEPKKPK
jgi:hypothetical protein